jgi:hypothetical protein
MRLFEWRFVALAVGCPREFTRASWAADAQYSMLEHCHRPAQGFKFGPVGQLSDRLTHGWCGLVGEPEHDNPGVAGRRITTHIAQAAVQRD